MIAKQLFTSIQRKKNIKYNGVDWHSTAYPKRRENFQKIFLPPTASESEFTRLVENLT